MTDLPPFILKKFAKDTGYPIHIFEEPYFSHQLKMCERIAPECQRTWVLFLQALQECDGPEGVSQEYRRIQDGILTHIKSTHGYKFFMQDNDPSRPMIPKKGINPYEPHNAGKRILSLDLVRANFQALSHFGRDIHMRQPTWEDFVGQFTDVEYFKYVRYLRQVTYGKLNIKKMAKYERHLAHFVYSMLKDTGLVKKAPKGSELTTLSHDEVLFLSDPEYLDLTGMEVEGFRRHFLYSSPIETPIEIRAELFDLEQIKPHRAFVRRFVHEDKIDFRGVNKQWYCQVVRHLYGEPIQDLDLYFRHESRLSKFVEPMEFEGRVEDGVEKG